MAGDGWQQTEDAMFGSKKSAVEKAAVGEHKRARKTAKVEGKSAKAQEKAAKAAAKEPPGLIATLTDRKTAKRAIQVVTLVGPVVAPIALDGLHEGARLPGRASGPATRGFPRKKSARTADRPGRSPPGSPPCRAR